MATNRAVKLAMDINTTVIDLERALRLRTIRNELIEIRQAVLAKQDRARLDMEARIPTFTLGLNGEEVMTVDAERIFAYVVEKLDARFTNLGLKPPAPKMKRGMTDAELVKRACSMGRKCGDKS
jgi:uncharacterized protein (DUF2164 family)